MSARRVDRGLSISLSKEHESHQYCTFGSERSFKVNHYMEVALSEANPSYEGDSKGKK